MPWKDFQFALRILRTRLALTTITVTSLALVIGANTAVFSLIDAFLLKSLPVHRPEQLMAVENRTDRGLARAFSYPMFEELRDQQRVFSGLFGWGTALLDVNAENDEEQVSGMFITDEFFSTLGIRAVLGRTITEEDTQPASSPVAMISYRFWERRFERDPAAIGRTIRVDDFPLSIVGIAPPEFFGLSVGSHADIFVPFTTRRLITPGFPGLDSRSLLILQLMGRLSDGVSSEQAQASLELLWPDLPEATIPADAAGNRRSSFLAQEIRLVAGRTGVSFMRRRFSDPLLILMVLSGSVVQRQLFLITATTILAR